MSSSTGGGTPSFSRASSGVSSNASSSNNNGRIDLFEYTEEELLQDKVLTHYEVLNLDADSGPTPDEIKKAYRKTSLRYHPDKTGRGSEDYVFLAVKAAYDVLMDDEKRQAYDSTVVPFDDAIPESRVNMKEDSELLYEDGDDFYRTFGPVFERNYRFDARLRPDLLKKKNGGANKRVVNHMNSNVSNSSSSGNIGNKNKSYRPSLGDDDTPIDEVRAFYEYWVHFESWRDFSAQAADELQLENELDNAESRFERRWLQKEIEKRAKQHKKTELGRIQTLVERAMEADPRLRRAKQEERDRKEQQKQRRLEEEMKQLELEKERQLQQELLEERERERLALEKAEREQHKKLLRKARQQLRRTTKSSYEAVQQQQQQQQQFLPVLWDDSYDMNQDVEYLCTNLELRELEELNAQYSERSETKDDNDERNRHHSALTIIKQRVRQLRQEEEQQQQSAAAAEEEQQQKEQQQPSSLPWTKDELSALAKAVRKCPPGSVNRWEQITKFVNHTCKQAVPRTKEECTEKFNQIARTTTTTAVTANGISDKGRDAIANTSGTDNKNNPASSATAAASGGISASATAAASATGWTAEQDQQLQDGLAKFPTRMDKNERWKKIAAAVEGKTKKDCVQRFKAIREALLQNKKE